jgi:hypothetical protein
MVDHIYSGDRLLAMVVAADFSEDGVNFVTPHSLSQQLAFIRHPVGKVIEPHLHNPISREVLYTQEVLIIRRGVIRVDFYGDDREFLDSRILRAGDVILLVAGGHGFEVLEEVEIIEVKQGPFDQDNDKTRFNVLSGSQRGRHDPGE